MRGRRWTWGGLAGTVLLTCTTGGLRAQAPPPAAGVSADGSRVVAVVNGEPISAAALEAAMRQMGPTPVAVPEAQRRQNEMEVLYRLIGQVVMRQFLAKNARPVDPAEVNKQIAELEAGLKKQNKTLADFCRELNQTEAQLRQDLGTLLQSRAYASERLTDADVEKYYKENKDFFDRITVRVSHIMVRLPQQASPAERDQARARLLALRQEILANRVDFAEAARKHSDCPISKDKGGDLGYLMRKMMPIEESFVKAAFALQVNGISDVVQTEGGLHLIKVTDRKADGQPSNFATIKDDVREVCLEEMLQQILVQQMQSSRIENYLAPQAAPPGVPATH
jgi:parvulin-like peptidyl-prolyl isomerase